MSEEIVSVGSLSERLRALEGKLAAAVGPHVALDREIAEAIGLNVHFDTFLEKPMVLETTEWGARISHDIKPYTSSIDAALTLVPTPYKPRIDFDGYPVVFLYEKVEGIRCQSGFAKPLFRSDAPTAPLALCLAAVRARIALESADDTHTRDDVGGRDE